MVTHENSAALTEIGRRLDVIDQKFDTLQTAVHDYATSRAACNVRCEQNTKSVEELQKSVAGLDRFQVKVLAIFTTVQTVALGYLTFFKK